jgi:molybdopterin-guanine dinucleotide biosynthesis protein
MSMLVTANELQLVADAVDRREPAQLAQRFLGEADLVLAEGFSHAAGVKIEVLRRECGKPPRCAIEDDLIAMVTDMDEVYPQLPHFALEDIAAVRSSCLTENDYGLHRDCHGGRLKPHGTGQANVTLGERRCCKA